MKFDPEIAQFSIVFLGNLNPVIFTPKWLQACGLITEEDESACEINIIHQEVSQFSSPWFQIQVQRNRFQLTQEGPSDIQIFDLARKLFREFLPHTPLRAAGLNRHYHNKLNDYHELHAIGDALAPKQVWGKWGEQILSPPTVHNPDFKPEAQLRRGGLQSITMEESARSNGEPGQLRATVQTSRQITPGIYIAFNDHYELPKADESVGAIDIVEIVERNFERSTQQTEEIALTILGLTDHDNKHGHK